MVGLGARLPARFQQPVPKAKVSPHHPPVSKAAAELATRAKARPASKPQTPSTPSGDEVRLPGTMLGTWDRNAGIGRSGGR